MAERKNPLLKDEEISSSEENSPEFVEIKTYFNTLLNDNSRKEKYEPELYFSLKNQKFELNFEKLGKNEAINYGWFNVEDLDEKKREEFIIKLKTKGLEEIKEEILVSPLPISNFDPIRNIILCKFIIGKSKVIYQDEPLEEKDKEKYKKEYDTIIREPIYPKRKKMIKRYNILKKENIDLLYLIILREPEVDF